MSEGYCWLQNAAGGSACGAEAQQQRCLSLSSRLRRNAQSLPLVLGSRLYIETEVVVLIMSTAGFEPGTPRQVAGGACR